MNPFKWFRFAEEKTFAKQMADRLEKELPPALMQERSKLLTVNKITRMLERTYQLAKSYQVEVRMGWIRRAVLANYFKWCLRNKGYPDDFVDIATEGLVVEFSHALNK
jgi:hypothetical protein